MKALARGFTLMELLLVLALLAVLTRLALPHHQAHMAQAHRSQVRQTLHAVTQRMDALHSEHGRYAQSDSGKPEPIDDAWLLRHAWEQWPPKHHNSPARYRLRFLEGRSQDQAFVLLAEPVGAQSQDSCGVLMLDQRQVRGAQGVLDSRAEQTRRCWSR